MTHNRPATSDSTAADDSVTERGEVRRARDGDLAAFESLYRRHVGRIHGLCLRFSGNPAQAEELTQEVFLQAWRKLEGFRGDSAFGTWLHRLAVNLNLQSLRGSDPDEEQYPEAEEGSEAPSAPPRRDPVSHVDLERAVAELPEGARKLFLLYELEGYTHDEIASLTGVAPGTSRAQVFRARKLLRKAMQR